MGTYMDVVLEQRQADGTWRGRKLIDSAKDYELFDEFGWLGEEIDGRMQRYDDDLKAFVDIPGVIPPRGLPDDFDHSIIDEDDGEEIGHSPGWLSCEEFTQAVGRCMAKRGCIYQGFPEAIAELSTLNFPPPEQARLVFWFD